MLLRLSRFSTESASASACFDGTGRALPVLAHPLDDLLGCGVGQLRAQLIHPARRVGPREFRFAIKANRYLMHNRKLRAPRSSAPGRVHAPGERAVKTLAQPAPHLLLRQPGREGGERQRAGDELSGCFLAGFDK